MFAWIPALSGFLSEFYFRVLYFVYCFLFVLVPGRWVFCMIRVHIYLFIYAFVCDVLIMYFRPLLLVGNTRGHLVQSYIDTSCVEYSSVLKDGASSVIRCKFVFAWCVATRVGATACVHTFEFHCHGLLFATTPCLRRRGICALVGSAWVYLHSILFSFL